MVEPANNPPSPGLSNNTLRQVFRVSLGGDTLRLRFSNKFGTSSVTLNEVHIAVSAGGDTIDPGTDRVLNFSGGTAVTIAGDTSILSDPFNLLLQPGTNAAVTIYFGNTSADITGHPGSRTTSYLLSGNHVSGVNFAGAVKTDHWYIINTLEVKAPDSAAAVVILGNSITDGRGSGTNRQNRWPDELSRRLQKNPGMQQVAVLNQGIGGNCVLSGGLGPTALSRFGRDVLEQSGVRWLIVFEGINDIGQGGVGIGNKLIDAYRQMVHDAHSNGIFVYGATLLPMGGSSYYSAEHEAERQVVNAWMRHGGFFDAVIDLDLALRNPADTSSLRPEADSGDHLHPNETGHRLIAEAVDLDLFSGRDSLVYSDDSYTVYFEAECAAVGGSWDIASDAQASNGKYIAVKSGIQSLSEAPTGSGSTVVIPFSVDTAGIYSIYVRLNCATYDDDSYWVKMDAEQFQMYNGLLTSGWEWKKLNDWVLTGGAHALTIAYREDGAKLDKIGVSNSSYAPAGIGGAAENLCTPMGILDSAKVPGAYTLGQNYPNPFNPTTSIKYYLSQKSKVIVEVLNISGRTVETLINKVQSSGEHTITFDGSALASGIYFYRMTTSAGIKQSKKMLLIK